MGWRNQRNITWWGRAAAAAILGAHAICMPICARAKAAAPTSVVGIEFVGRMVRDLDESVRFYKTIGFSQDFAADPAWRTDDLVNHLYHVRGARTRVAKMFVHNDASGQRFVVYLREFKGIERRDVSGHTPWDPGSSHFGLIVPDAAAVWSQLKATGMLRARSWGDQLIAPPGQTRGLLAYMTDPDGLDIELIEQRPAAGAEGGRPARAALLPGVSHVGLVVLDSDKARGFYGDLLGGQLQATSAPWQQGDFYDSAVGGHGNVLRFFNESFPEALAPDSRMNVELVEFQNRKKPVAPTRITDIGVGYVGFEVKGLDALLDRIKASGGTVVSDGIVTMKTGVRVVAVRDPDVGGFAELFEQPSE